MDYDGCSLCVAIEMHRTWPVLGSVKVVLMQRHACSGLWVCPGLGVNLPILVLIYRLSEGYTSFIIYHRTIDVDPLPRLFLSRLYDIVASTMVCDNA